MSTERSAPRYAPEDYARAEIDFGRAVVDGLESLEAASAGKGVPRDTMLYQMAMTSPYGRVRITLDFLE